MRRGGMWGPGLLRQRGAEPAPSLGDPRCFPCMQSSGRSHRALRWGCGALGGGSRSDSSQQPACLSWRACCPSPGWQKSWSGGLSARGVSPGAPICQGLVLHGVEEHDSYNQTGPTALRGRSGPGSHCHPAARGEGFLLRVAQPLIQWGLWSGAARQTGGQLEQLVQRRWRGWEQRLWELLLCPTAPLLPGTTGFL